MNEKLNLFEKIQKVSIEIMNIEKDMTVGSGNYSYKAISDLQVTLAVKKAEQQYRLISIPTNVELINSEVINKSGCPCNNASLRSTEFIGILPTMQR